MKRIVSWPAVFLLLAGAAMPAWADVTPGRARRARSADIAGSAAAQKPPLDTRAIERATGAKGAWIAAEGVFKVSLPRTDLSAVAEGVKLTPPMGLTSWASFRSGAGGTMVMGDVVLTEDRVAPAMDAALAGGLAVTALHNHFAGESPRVMFMHISGMGGALRQAESVGKIFVASQVKEREPGRGVGAIDPSKSSLDTAALDRVLGVKGEYRGGVYRAVVGRSARMHGETLGSAMGVNTWAALTGSMSRAAVAGDFVMREEELQPVLRALRKGGLRIVAIHNHMTEEEPRLVFLHYWGTGPAISLAEGVRSALRLTSGS